MFRSNYVLAMLLTLLAPQILRAEPPRFDIEVMAVLSKSGCNLGACHGNASGKGGFKISLRGEDPAGDYNVLARENGARRIDVAQPEESLLLLKPVGTVPHQGGQRFTRDSQEYKILHDWIAAGATRELSASKLLIGLTASPAENYIVAPAESVQLKVMVKSIGGDEVDVTRLVTFEASNLNATVDATGLVQRAKFGETTVIARFLHLQTPVRVAFIPQRHDFAWSNPPANNYIDQHVSAKLERLRMNPSDLAADATFIRRASLDAIGAIPSAEETKSFITDQSPDKRQKLIDALLQREEFADFWALKWSDLLRNEEKVLDAKGVDAFHGWIKKSIATGKPMDQFARELVSSRGSTYLFPEANYYRANRDPFTRAETTARLFLGVRLQCAKCHNHPFDRWTQDDYYSWAAWFPQIDYQVIRNGRVDQFDKNAFEGEQIVYITGGGKVMNARTGEEAPPKFLGDVTPKTEATFDKPVILAEWIGSPTNDLFVKTQVNFVWYHLLGRGLVEPIDDMRATNPPSHPALLDALGKDFAEHKFDLRHLVRTIMNSRTYQLSSVPNATNADDIGNFARSPIRRLSAEQLIDAQSKVLGVSPKFNGYPEGTLAIQMRGTRRGDQGKNGPTGGDRLLKMFGKPERLLACECERSSETTLSQAFLSISDEGLQKRLADPKNGLKKLLDSGSSDAEVLDELYWSALGHGPTNEEREIGLALLASSDDKFSALQDLAWALMNAKEFMFRR